MCFSAVAITFSETQRFSGCPDLLRYSKYKDGTGVISGLQGLVSLMGGKADPSKLEIGQSQPLPRRMTSKRALTPLASGSAVHMLKLGATRQIQNSEL